ncbi:hypothetical protein PFMALIP_01135 [Plasmodium falciparum MaliPS096_E11]|uniref:Uncharacterized protein n=1 Tax=Plasmodium falciparum MaliPS096_E11 TaxID=1036727 RepID=A0A024WUZ4_PLAFA|nr:hypothetical protein PFMALIP_01135 [Plasmodium falciparum MaliPS096_E11]
MSMYNILINYFVTINRFDVIYNQNEHLLIKDNYHVHIFLVKNHGQENMFNDRFFFFFFFCPIFYRT